MSHTVNVKQISGFVPAANRKLIEGVYFPSYYNFRSCSNMDLIIAILFVAGAIVLILVLKGRKEKNLYVKRGRHIQAFPPGHKKHNDP